jgi:imidazole glycerol-phosphate synthase subunit HisF
MLRPRIIPCLLVSAGGLVKTTGFADRRYIGDPINAVKIFNEKETDELIMLDIDATVSGAEPNFKLIADLAVECRMPLCYGGGIKTVDQARRIVGLGVEKIAIGAAATVDPGLIRNVASEIGSQSVVVVLDVRRKRQSDEYSVWTHNGRNSAQRLAAAFAAEAEHLGAGEILVNSIDNDGMMRGYDLALAAQIRRAINVPMTLLGGAGSLEHIGQLVADCGVIGAAAGSLFVYKGRYKAVLINYPTPAQKEELIRSSLAMA